LGKEKLELILLSAGFKVNVRNIVYNVALFHYLNDKPRLKKFNGKKFPVSNEHTYTIEEKQSMIEKSKVAKKALKNINANVTTSVNTPFLIKLNKNWEVLNYYLINKSPGDYFIDIYSNVYIDSNILYANLVYNPEVVTTKFPSNN
jgi:hypothetical protein